MIPHSLTQWWHRFAQSRADRLAPDINVERRFYTQVAVEDLTKEVERRRLAEVRVEMAIKPPPKGKKR